MTFGAQQKQSAIRWRIRGINDSAAIRLGVNRRDDRREEGGAFDVLRHDPMMDRWRQT